MLRRVLLLVILIVVSFSLTGCLVAESKYLKKVEEADGLNRDLTLLQQKYQSLASENVDLKVQAEKLAADLAGTTKERERLAADNKELEKVLKAKSDTLSKNIAELRQKVADLENENEKLRGDVASLQKAKEEKVREVSKTYENLLEKMKSEISQGQVTISELKGKLTVNLVDAILFDSGKSEVKSEGLAVLQKVIEILKTVNDKQIRIEGYTDNVQIVGALAKKYPTNWELSAARAINVARFLQEQGLDPKLLSAIAFSEYRPVADNATEEGRMKNRRIEIVLVPKDAP